MTARNLGKILPDIAAMDTLISLQSFTTAANDYGESAKTWSTYSTEYAAIEYAATGSGEAYTDAVNLQVTRVVFTIRWRNDISFLHRVLFEGDYYDIVKREELGRRRFIKITADRRL